MDVENKIKQIEKIIDKLDLINDDEWQKKNNETTEEYEDRIKKIEDNIEEELIDYISDILILDLKMNENIDIELDEIMEIVKSIINSRKNEGKVLKDVHNIKTKVAIADTISMESPIQPIIRKIPERKKIVYTNLEKKLDKNNDLTKKKIKVRIELKIIFKKFENKVLTKEEIENLNKQIKNIDNKYPGVIDDQLLDKLYCSYKIEKNVQENDGEKEKLSEKLKKLKEKSKEKIKNLVKTNKSTIIKISKISKKKLKLKFKKIKINEANKDKKMQSPKDENAYNNSKEELIELLKKVDKFNKRTKHSRGLDLLVIDNLINYLKYNNDSEMQKRLKDEIIALQTDKHDIKNELCVYNIYYTNVQTLKYMYDMYSNGIKSVDGKREIIGKDSKTASYYLYLANSMIKKLSALKLSEQQILSKNQTECQRIIDNANLENNESEKERKLALAEGFTKSIEKNKKYIKDYEEIEKRWNLKNICQSIADEYDSHTEEICYNYLEFLKEKYYIGKLSGIRRIKAEIAYVRELMSAEKNGNNTEYLDFAISSELVSRSVDEFIEEKYKKQLQSIESKLNGNMEANPTILKLLGEIYYNGTKNASDEDIILPNKFKAMKIYEKLIEQKGVNGNLQECSNLIEIYENNTSPLYDKSKADKLKEKMTQKGLTLPEKNGEVDSKKGSIYVCSDLHGEYLAYQKIIDQLKENDKLYILGDVIDRGSDGIKILQDVINRKKQNQVEFLIGNHEWMMIQTLFLGKKDIEKVWISKSNGGEETLKKFKELGSNEQEEIRKFLLNSYVYKNIEIDSQKVHLVHAKAVQEKDDVSDKTVKEMLDENKEDLIETAVWQRGERGNPHPQSAKKGIFTIIGHSPTDDSMLEYQNGYLDIDCGVAKSILDPNRVASLVNLTKGIIKYFNINYLKKKKEKDLNKKNKEK